MPQQVRIERKIWDKGKQSFVETGEVIVGDPDRLEKLTDKLTCSTDRYLSGPVPWTWIAAASELPGKALLVGLCIWRLVGVKKSRTIVLGNADLEPLGIDRAAKSRALSALEGVRLISVTREPGRFPIITVEGDSIGPCTGRSHDGVKAMRSRTLVNRTL